MTVHHKVWLGYLASARKHFDAMMLETFYLSTGYPRTSLSKSIFNKTWARFSLETAIKCLASTGLTEGEARECIRDQLDALDVEEGEKTAA